MKASQTRFTDGEETFVRACYDALQDLEMGSNLRTAIVMVRTQRRGVFTIEMGAFLAEDTDLAHPLCKVVKEWPNGVVMSLGGALFQMANSLSQMAPNAAKEKRESQTIWPK